jgi:hypothetical protein
MIKLHMFFWEAIFRVLCSITMDHTLTSLVFLWSEEKGLVLWWLTPIFQQYFIYILAVSFIGEGNQQKTTSLPQVTDKLAHIKYTSPCSGIKLTIVVTCSDCTGSCRSSYLLYSYEVRLPWIILQRHLYSYEVRLQWFILQRHFYSYEVRLQWIILQRHLYSYEVKKRG